ncbi:hypothetical protein FPZ12_033830 [Amycolatopsis acidicola]|uniref:Uncharacterized protein n=1 Tax=Amycolatopsis acidicola TaxID=2596893 RepID=A0A5N0US20_9PSEU|nr:hypothetical protein [Amycolatopsis acidicola]KAA9153697.1 hypothetical protein FPZ12_033830 [Amycolatopsis acidicola]
MRVKDSHGEFWQAYRRMTPWHRLVQPANLAQLEYSRYRVAPKRPSVIEQSKRRRAERQERQEAKREQRKITGWHWLYMGPALVVGVLVIGLAAQALEAVVYFLVFLAWLVLMPFYLVELVARTVVGAGLWLARLTGLARSRVDVVGGLGQVQSLTKVLVPGFGNAGHLVRAVVDQRRTSAVPFDPRDPAVGRLLGAARAEVTEHASVWSAPAPVMPGR